MAFSTPTIMDPIIRRPHSAMQTPPPPPPSEAFYNAIYGITKKPRSFAQWVEAAQRHTADILEYGSTSPLVWVLVRGRDIPNNALLAGEERRRPLYVARTFFEGGICIGKAGSHLESGAAFAYNGREVHTEVYEVLVPAFQPLRFSISGKYKISSIPRICDDSIQDTLRSETGNMSTSLSHSSQGAAAFFLNSPRITSSPDSSKFSSIIHHSFANVHEQRSRQLRKDEYLDRRSTSELERPQSEAQRQAILISSLHQKLDEALATVDTKSRFVAQLEEELTRLKDDSSNQSLAAQLASSKSEVARQSELINSLRDNLERTLSLVQVKTEAANALEEELIASKRGQATYRREREPSRLENTRQSSLVASLRQDLAKALADFHSRDEAARDLENELAQFRIQEAESNRSLKAELELAQSELSHQCTLVSSLRQELERNQTKPHVASQGRIGYSAPPPWRLPSPHLATNSQVVNQDTRGLEAGPARSRGERTEPAQDLAAELARQTSLVDSLRRDLEHSQSAAAIRAQALTDLEDELAQLKRERAEFSRSLAAGYKSAQFEHPYPASLVPPPGLERVQPSSHASNQAMNDLRRELAQREHTVQDLKAELELSRQELTRHVNLNASLHRDLEHAQSEVYTKAQAVDDLETELTHLKETTQRSSSEPKSSYHTELVVSLRRDLERAVSDLDTERRTTRNLRGELAQLRDNGKYNERPMFNPEPEVTRQSNQIASLRRELDEARSDSQLKSQAVSKLDEELAQVKKHSEESSQRLAFELQSSQREAARHSNLISSLRRELQEALSTKIVEEESKQLQNGGKELHQRLASELTSSKLEIASLQWELARLQSDLEVKSQATTSLEGELAQLRRDRERPNHRPVELSTLSSQVASLQQQLDKALSNYQEKCQVVTNLEEQLMQLQKDKDESTRRHVTDFEEIARYSRQGISLQQQLDKALDDYRERSQFASNLEEQLAQLKAQVQSGQRLARSEELVGQSSQITSLRQMLDKAVSDHQEQCRVSSTLEEELLMVKKEREKSEQHLASELALSKLEIKHQADEVASLQHKLTSLLQNPERPISDRGKERWITNNLRAELTENSGNPQLIWITSLLQKLDKELSGRQEEKQREDMATLTDTAIYQNEQVHALHEALRAQSRELDEAKEALRNAREEVKELQLVGNVTGGDSGRLRPEVVKHRDESNQPLQQRLDRALSDYRERCQVVERLEEQLTQSKKDKEELTRRLADYEGLIDQTSQVTRLQRQLRGALSDYREKHQVVVAVKEELLQLMEKEKLDQRLAPGLPLSKFGVRLQTDEITSRYQKLAMLRSQLEVKIQVVNVLEKQLRQMKDNVGCKQCLSTELQSFKLEVTQELAQVISLCQEFERTDSVVSMGSLERRLGGEVKETFLNLEGARLRGYGHVTESAWLTLRVQLVKSKPMSRMSQRQKQRRRRTSQKAITMERRSLEQQRQKLWIIRWHQTQQGRAKREMSTTKGAGDRATRLRSAWNLRRRILRLASRRTLKSSATRARTAEITRQLISATSSVKRKEALTDPESQATNDPTRTIATSQTFQYETIEKVRTVGEETRTQRATIMDDADTSNFGRTDEPRRRAAENAGRSNVSRVDVKTVHEEPGAKSITEEYVEIRGTRTAEVGWSAETNELSSYSEKSQQSSATTGNLQRSSDISLTWQASFE